MTQQQQYAPPNYPPQVQPQQQYQAPYPQPQQPPFQPYGQQPYAPPAPPQQPVQPLVQGTLDDYYSQPTAGGGPSISWSVNGMQKPLGTTYAGIVARDVVHGDVQQDTDPKTGQGKFYRDGRPRFVMKVPLRLQPSQEFPEGEAQWFVRGQARDELTRAMTAAGLTGNVAPKEGDAIQVTLVERRPSRGGGMPANIVQVLFQPGPRHQVGAAPGQGAAAAQAPVTEAASPASVASPPQAANPMSQPAQPAQQPFYQQQAQAYTQQPGPAQPVEQQGPPPQWAQQPAPQPQQQLAPPAGLDPEQQQLLAGLQAQQAGQQG